MRIKFAYITVILLWATTPLAIKWSGEGPGFLFAVTSRMAIGLFCVLFLLMLLRRPIPFSPKARMTYLAVAIQIYGSMIAVYWSAQFIPSGWISVIFGFAPLMTALIAAFFYKDQPISLIKLCAYGLGVYGLYIMLGSAIQFGISAVYGIAGILVATLLQSVGALWIKHIKAELPALTQVAGGLGIALPLYLLTWAQFDGNWPVILTPVNIAAIAYLGIIATTVGFSLYYYLLTHLSAVRVALISLLTPVMSLLLGHLANNEILTRPIIFGTALILSALLLHEIVDRSRKSHRLSEE